MKIMSLLYVSESTLSAADGQTDIDDIVAAARRRNPFMDLTGALMFTGSHFAQVLEGQAADIAELIDRVKRDPRHRNVRIMDQGPIVARRFPHWSMAYAGPSGFVSRFVTRLIEAPSQLDRARAAKMLADLMREFTASASTPASRHPAPPVSADTFARTAVRR